MRTSIWFRTEEKQPDKDGLYLTYRGWGMGGKGDGDHDHGYLYYRVKDGRWYEYEGAWRSSFPDVVHFVYYWTDADPVDWVEKEPPSVQLRKLKQEDNVALNAAYKDVLVAIDKYNMMKELLR